MSINDTKEYFGKSYTAVEYIEPIDFMPTDDDIQCKICAVEPFFCGIKHECHGAIPFVFVKTEYADAMNLIGFMK